jgi:hypothetical protein
MPNAARMAQKDAASCRVLLSGFLLTVGVALERKHGNHGLVERLVDRQRNVRRIALSRAAPPRAGRRHAEERVTYRRPRRSPDESLLVLGHSATRPGPRTKQADQARADHEQHRWFGHAGRGCRDTNGEEVDGPAVASVAALVDGHREGV